MATNAFSKEIRVAWEQMLEGFEDLQVMSKNCSVYSTDSTMMARANDVIWRPQPYIMTSYDGADQTSNFLGKTQLSVPATLGYRKVAPWTLSALDLRDQLQEGRLFDGAKQKLASDINVALMNVAANEGTLVVKRTSAATGFDDVAQCEAIMNEQGVPAFDRYLALSTRDYNGMASTLAGKGTLTGKALTAYDRAYVGIIGGFDTFKLDYANRITAAAGVTVTVNGANQYYTPVATSTTSSGARYNVDNRYQNLTIGVSSGTVAVGDCFTIAGVYAVNHITKASTGQLKTFRITAIVSGGGGAGVVTISPPIISGGGATQAELQYQNVSATPANGAAITFLNTAAAYINPFWQKDALEILPGNIVVPDNAGAAVMTGTTSNGIKVTLQKFYDINTSETKFRVDTFFGVVNKQPEMSGIMLFSQT